MHSIKVNLVNSNRSIRKIISVMGFNNLRTISVTTLSIIIIASTLFYIIYQYTSHHTPLGSSTSSHTESYNNSEHWLMSTSLINKLRSSDRASAQYFFNTPNAFAKSNPVPGYSTIPIASYTSYAQFSKDLQDGKFPGTYHWVMFGLESTTDTPTIEKQEPNVYFKSFATLAHQHGLKVVEVPGRDLVAVPGANCTHRPGETLDQAYIRCDIQAETGAADISLIQAQTDQPNVNAYSYLVSTARKQVLAANPHIIVMAGLTTDRGSSASQMFTCWQATHGELAGYWMNSSSDKLLEVAQLLDQIRSSSN